MQYLYWRTNLQISKEPLKKLCLVVRINTWKQNIFWCLETVGREESSNFIWWISSRAKDNKTCVHVPFPEEDVHGNGSGHQWPMLIILPPNCELLSFGTSSGFYVTYLTLPACLSPITNTEFSQKPMEFSKRSWINNTITNHPVKKTTQEAASWNVEKTSWWRLMMALNKKKLPFKIPTIYFHQAACLTPHRSEGRNFSSGNPGSGSLVVLRWWFFGNENDK